MYHLRELNTLNRGKGVTENHLVFWNSLLNDNANFGVQLVRNLFFELLDCDRSERKLYSLTTYDIMCKKALSFKL